MTGQPTPPQKPTGLIAVRIQETHHGFYKPGSQGPLHKCNHPRNSRPYDQGKNSETILGFPLRRPWLLKPVHPGRLTAGS